MDDAFPRALGLDPMELDALRIVMGAFELHRRPGDIADREVLARLAEILDLPSIAHLVATRAWTEPALEPFVAAIGRAAGGRHIVGAGLVRAACAEARDDVAAAERLLRSAAAAEPGYGPVCAELAHYDVDPGDYRGALANLRAAGVPPDDPERAWLETVLRPAFPAVGRNEPCPCGSGRKYKACHLGKPVGSNVDPASALLHKVSWWLAQPDNQHRAAELVRLAQDEHAGDPPEDLVDQPLVNDILLFDQGQLARFLDVRGPLLPEQEAALGRVWLASRRSLYEVQAVRPGAGVTLRDRLQRRWVVDLLRAADGVALLRWFAARALPIEVRNTEGEPLRFVTATYQVSDPVATATALARTRRTAAPGRGSFDARSAPSTMPLRRPPRQEGRPPNRSTSVPTRRWPRPSTRSCATTRGAGSTSRSRPSADSRRARQPPTTRPVPSSRRCSTTWRGKNGARGIWAGRVTVAE